MHSVIETRRFRIDAKEADLTEDEVNSIVSTLGADPEAGELIPGSGGARKLRFPGRGKGKRGGYRVITYFAGEDVPVFLLNVFSKGDCVDLSQAERNLLRRELPALAEDYKRGVGRNVESR